MPQREVFGRLTLLMSANVPADLAVSLGSFVRHAAQRACALQEEDYGRGDSEFLLSTGTAGNAAVHFGLVISFSTTMASPRIGTAQPTVFGL